MTEEKKVTTIPPQTISPKTALIRTVESNLGKLLQDQAEAMPKGFNQTRFLQNCLAVLNDTPDIEKFSPVSVARTLIKAAYLDLDFFTKECYAIPRKDKLTFQTDYKGEVKIVRTYSVKKIADIYAKLVREGDELTLGVVDGKQICNFKEKLFNNGPILGAFAVVLYEDGMLSYRAMSTEEIEHVRKVYSGFPNSGAWVNSFGEMCLKTVIRKLRKDISIKFNNQEQEKAYEEGGDAQFPPAGQIVKDKPKVEDPFAPSNTVDVAATPEPAGNIESKPFPGEMTGHLPNDPDAKLRREFKELHPTYEDWQIDALIKERKEIL